jgi:hypothetical protein
VGLSFRVRDGTGRFPHAMTAVTLAPHRPAVPGVGNLWLQHVLLRVIAGVVLLFCCRFLLQRAVGDGFVGWEPHSGRKQSCFFLPPRGANAFEVRLRGWCVV